MCRLIDAVIRSDGAVSMRPASSAANAALLRPSGCRLAQVARSLRCRPTPRVFRRCRTAASRKDADSAAQQGGALQPPPQQVQQQPAQQQAQQTPQPQMGAASGGLPNELLLDTLDTNVWAYKPAWCQPYSIVATGGLVVTGAWLVSGGSPGWTAAAALPVAAWWYLFLAVYPTQFREYAEGVNAERRQQQQWGSK